MKYLIILFFVLWAPVAAFSQCTLSGTGTINWSNATPPSCQEGGTATAYTVIIIPAGVTLNFNDNGDTWTGVRIEVNGTLRISAPGQVQINSTIEIKNGGTLRIDSKLNIGAGTGCGFGLIIRSGGSADITGGTPDRLTICGQEIARGGTAGCNPYPAGPAPYCEPTGGFPGPVGFDETGINNNLPITLMYFDVSLQSGNKVRAAWATALEKNVSHFVVERSANGKEFTEIGRIPAVGESNQRKEYSLIDNDPLIGKNYYRLKEVDLDGQLEHFNMRYLNITGKKKILVYPSPATSEDALTVTMNFSTDEKAQVRVTDLSGHEIWKSSFTGTQTMLPSHPAKGSYIVTVTTAGETYVTRYIVR